MYQVLIIQNEMQVSSNCSEFDKSAEGVTGFGYQREDDKKVVTSKYRSKKGSCNVWRLYS